MPLKDASFASPLAALKAAVAAYGSQGATARARGVSQPSVWRWVNIAQRLPPEHVLGVEADTGISRHDLRPDIYPLDDTVVHAGRGLDAIGAAR